MIYELRVYQPVPGQMPKLLARFRDKLLPIWEKNTLSDTQIKALDQVVDWWLCLPEYPRLHLGSYFVGSNPGLATTYTEHVSITRGIANNPYWKPDPTVAPCQPFASPP